MFSVMSVEMLGLDERGYLSLNFLHLMSLLVLPLHVRIFLPSNSTSNRARIFWDEFTVPVTLTFFDLVG